MFFSDDLEEFTEDSLQLSCLTTEFHIVVYTSIFSNLVILWSYSLTLCIMSFLFSQIEKICKVANKPLVVTYTGLIQACLDSGNIQNAAYIFDQVYEFCSPNLITYNVMLKAYVEHGMFEEAKELFGKMLGDENHISSKSDYRDRVVLPDIYTFNTMLDACNAEKRWDDFEYVYKRMLHHGFHFNAKRHLRMILDASRAGKVFLSEIFHFCSLLRLYLVLKMYH